MNRKTTTASDWAEIGLPVPCWPEETAEEIAAHQAYELRRVEEIIKNRVRVAPWTPMSPLAIMQVYIVCEHQYDPHYEGFPTRVVFTDREKACAYIAAENIRSAITDPHAYDNPFYIQEGEMQ